LRGFLFSAVLVLEKRKGRMSQAHN